MFESYKQWIATLDETFKKGNKYRNLHRYSTLLNMPISGNLKVQDRHVSLLNTYVTAVRPFLQSGNAVDLTQPSIIFDGKCSVPVRMLLDTCISEGNEDGYNKYILQPLREFHRKLYPDMEMTETPATVCKIPANPLLERWVGPGASQDFAPDALLARMRTILSDDVVQLYERRVDLYGTVPEAEGARIMEENGPFSVLYYILENEQVRTALDIQAKTLKPDQFTKLFAELLDKYKDSPAVAIVQQLLKASQDGNWQGLIQIVMQLMGNGGGGGGKMAGPLRGRK